MSETDSLSIASSDEESRTPSDIVEEEPLFFILNKFLKFNDQNIVEVLREVALQLKELNTNLSNRSV